MLCCAMGLLKMHRVQAVIVAWVLAGSFMCSNGEVFFVLIGSLIQ